MSGKFEFKKSESKKTFNIVLKGNFDPESGRAYVEAYNKNINSINPSEYILEFDCVELAVSGQESLPVLRSCFETYAKAGFKKVISIIDSKNIVLGMQINRIARETGLPNFELIKK